MGSRGNRKLQLIILLVLVSLVGTMSIAYAVLSTTLNINGTAQVQDASWNIHFDNVQVNPYSVEINPVITDNNKITFSADLTTPGDFYKFTVDIVNEGSIDAMIESIAKVPELTTEQKKYLRYEVEYVDGTSISDSQLLKTGETKTISVLFSYRNDIPTSNLPTTETEFDLEIVLVYVQANNQGIEIIEKEKMFRIVSGDLNTVGSEFCIDTECFYLVSNDGYSIKFLSKYNLYIGNKCMSVNSCEVLEQATGLQDSSMIGYPSNGSYPRYGTLQFSTTTYWSDNGLKEEYGENYPTYVYDSNSELYNYIESYKTYLQNKNINIKNARLISYEELVSLGCNRQNSSCINAPEWVYGTSYWTGNAGNDTVMWHVSTDKAFFAGEGHYKNFLYGLRPIIEIETLEF